MSKKETLEKRKARLLNELQLIEAKESELMDEKQRMDNYKKFKHRISDWVIGKAHADIGLHYENLQWVSKSLPTIGDTISIHGNIGTSYNAWLQVTDATNIYFHSVWSDEQRRNFQKRLNEFALEEIKKIIFSLPQIIDLLALNLGSSQFCIEHLYPKDKKDEIENEVWKEICHYLDTYSNDNFLQLINADERGYLPHHGDSILNRYIFEKRKELIPEFEKVETFKVYMKKVNK